VFVAKSIQISNNFESRHMLRSFNLPVAIARDRSARPVRPRGPSCRRSNEQEIIEQMNMRSV
jgi:hypothetical protein